MSQSTKLFIMVSILFLVFTTMSMNLSRYIALLWSGSPAKNTVTRASDGAIVSGNPITDAYSGAVNALNAVKSKINLLGR